MLERGICVTGGYSVGANKSLSTPCNVALSGSES